MDFIITKLHDGHTLLDYLVHELMLSHKAISRLKRLENGMLLCGRHVTVRALLHEDDSLSLALEDESSSDGILPTELPINIIYEDEHLIALCKPPNMPTHPSHGHFTDTLANALAYYFMSKGQSFVFRAISRLDRDTSGIVLVAKDKQTAARMSRQMEDGQIKKSYLALLCGRLTPERGQIDKHIRRTAESIITRETVDVPTPDSQRAVTNYRTLASDTYISLVAASPLTGRTHQLRVHFADKGAPIVGDTLYGSSDCRIDRQALHAYSLAFFHPYTGEPIRLYADIPGDMAKIVGQCGFSLPTEMTKGEFLC